ncbi:MAG: hypothetical protein ACREPI_00335 [Candidatus Dormibacterales bacterium]
MFGWRKRLGYISPGALEISVYDFYMVAPPGVGLVALSAPISDWEGGEYRKNLDQVEAAAAYLARRHVDMVIHAGAPPVASRGAAYMHELVEMMARTTGLPASTALHSAMEAFRALGAQRVAVVTPFPAETHRAVVSVVAEEGFTIEQEERMEADFFTLHEAGRRQVFDFVTRALRRAPRAEVAYVPCPQWQVFEMAPELEKDARMPLVTSDGGDFWYAFKTLGTTDVRPGHGILLDSLLEPAAAPGPAGGQR